MSDISPIEAAFVWHIRGLTAALSKQMQRPTEQIASEVVELVPAVARHISTLAEMSGYQEDTTVKVNPSAGIIMLVSLTLGMGVYKMIEKMQADTTADPLSDRAEVTNLLRKLGLEKEPDSED